MSVYKPAKSRFYHFDFVFEGTRVHGSSGCETRRKAEAVERKKREDLALGRLTDAAQMTLDLAVGRWWQERGRHLGTADAIERRLDLLLTLIGPNRRIVDITTSVVGEAMEKRRGMDYARASGKKAKRYAVSNRTVNLDVIDTLRPVLRKAKRAWGATGLPEIDWGELRLAETKAKPKEFSDAELQALLDATPAHWHDFIRMAARYAPRLEEMFFHPAALDVDDHNDARVTLRERKGGDDHIIPLLAEDAAILAARKGRAIAANLDTVWYRELKGGRLKALSYHAAESAIRRAITSTGLRATKGLKGPHDLRRNGGMKILRATGNLRLAQRLLGHASIQSTLTYAHAIESDVKAGLAAVSRNSPEPVVETQDEVLKIHK
jgi:integrase